MEQVRGDLESEEKKEGEEWRETASGWRGAGEWVERTRGAGADKGRRMEKRTCGGRRKRVEMKRRLGGGEQ